MHILPFFVMSSNSYTTMLDSCSSLFNSMTLQVIDGILYDISRNPKRTISSIKVSMTSNVTQKLCLYNLATLLNRRPVSRGTTVLASYWARCLNIIVPLRIHAPVDDHYWSNHPTNLSVLENFRLGIQLASELTYSLYYNDLPTSSGAWMLNCRYNLQYRSDVL